MPLFTVCRWLPSHGVLMWQTEQARSLVSLFIKTLILLDLNRLPCSSNGKESACEAGDQSMIPGLGSSSGEGNGNPLLYSCLDNSMDREAWQATMGSQRVGHNWATFTYSLKCYLNLGGPVVKNLPANAGDVRDAGSIPGLGGSPGGGHGNPLQYPCLENPVDRGACWATAHGVIQSQTRLKWLSIHKTFCLSQFSPLPSENAKNSQWPSMEEVLQRT